MLQETYRQLSFSTIVAASDEIQQVRKQPAQKGKGDR